jgi:hypothetical protein
VKLVVILYKIYLDKLLCFFFRLKIILNFLSLYYKVQYAEAEVGPGETVLLMLSVQGSFKKFGRVSEAGF